MTIAQPRIERIDDPSITETDAQFLGRLLAGDFLLWSPNIQSEAFLHWDRIFATRTIERGTPRPLPYGEEIQSVPFTAYGVDQDIEGLMAGDHISGLLVVKNGEIRLEKYAKGLTPDGRWQSSSMVKSLAAILIGAAEHDGLLNRSDLVTTWLPEFGGTAYEGVTIEHLLTMTSGVAWSEDTDDWQSDVADNYIRMIGARKVGAIQAYQKTLPREVEAGTSYYYNTGDTFLLGLILKAATGKTPSEYCSEKVWKPMGMEMDGFFMLDGDAGDEVVGSCSGASLRDYARWGLLMLGDGVAADGTRILSSEWVRTSTSPQAAGFAFDFAGKRGESAESMDTYAGYGYLWWIRPDGSYLALGSYGEWIHVDPAQDQVVVMLGAIPRVPYMAQGIPEKDGANSHLGTDRRMAFIESVTRQLA